MDTIYYHLTARRVKVSGGADLLTFQPTPAPAPQEGRGEVLDFARCRQRLETKAAWNALTDAALETAPEQEQVLPAAPSRRERTAGWLDICASAAVIAVSLAAIAAFIAL